MLSHKFIILKEDYPAATVDTVEMGTSTVAGNARPLHTPRTAGCVASVHSNQTWPEDSAPESPTSGCDRSPLRSRANGEGNGYAPGSAACRPGPGPAMPCTRRSAGGSASLCGVLLPLTDTPVTATKQPSGIRSSIDLRSFADMQRSSSACLQSGARRAPGVNGGRTSGSLESRGN